MYAERGHEMKRAELKAFRISKGYTQKDVAEMLGVSTSHYACIEQGTHNPSTELVKVFCKVFGYENAKLIIGSWKNVWNRSRNRKKGSRRRTKKN